MNTITLNSGFKVPVFGLGTWKSAPGEVYQAVKWAIEAGYRHIDCAPIYGNEKEVGKALAECMQGGIVSREELFVTTKLWNNQHAADAVIPALKKSLSDLQLDYLDLYLIHWAVAQKPEAVFPEKPSDLASLDDYPLEQTWSSMEKAVDEGLCRSIGVSNFGPVNLNTVLKTARIKPAMNQVEAHPYLQQKELIAFCKEHKITITAYSPLGSNDRHAMLKADDEPVLLENKVLAEIAHHHNVSVAQVLIAWAIQRGTVVIPKSVNKQRIEQNLAATSLSLSQRDMDRIADLDIDRRYVDGSLWAMPGSPYTVEGVFQ